MAARLNRSALYANRNAPYENTTLKLNVVVIVVYVMYPQAHLNVTAYEASGDVFTL